MTTLLMQITPPDKLGQLMAVVSTPIILGPIIGPVSVPNQSSLALGLKGLKELR